jgi:hypothetical protein
MTSDPRADARADYLAMCDRYVPGLSVEMAKVRARGQSVEAWLLSNLASVLRERDTADRRAEIVLTVPAPD